MIPCPVCLATPPDGARFCPSCGAALSTSVPLPATERRVVSTLFADLVGYTSLGERHDPEDVDEALSAYFEMARSVVEWFGGVVEKYIGDAVVGLFGVPIAHEDDAERAVRAALEIIGRMQTLPPIGDERLEARAAVNTGEALVRLHALPGSAQGILVGDAVNTAARLLEATAPTTVAVGAYTHGLTERAIVYEPLPATRVKGKAQPIARWVASGAVARRGVDSKRRDDVPMIGREVPLAILSGLLDRATTSRSPQFALIVGEAGIGKSRLVRELFRVVDSRPGVLCTWRQGRCPPYGDGLAYWALREIVSAHAGITPDDGAEDIEHKLRQATGGDEAEEWLIGRLRPLAGLPAPTTERDENLAAWTRFFEGIARRRPAVIVVEDVHWASAQTLDFLRYFTRHAAHVPLLGIGTARPELVEEHPGLFERTPGLTRIDVRALEPDESLRLADALVPSSSAGVQQRVAGGCGGNPLFAEELSRFFMEQPSVRPPRGGTGMAPTAGEGGPTSIRSLMAARLDALPPGQRALLSDAAVVGLVFWPGALAAVAGSEPAEALALLEQLETREFVRRAERSVRPGEAEFSFWHALMREVAYERIPRLERAGKHAAVADWMEATERFAAIDSADLLAHHRWSALELARSAHDQELSERLREPAVVALTRAGERALALDSDAAHRYFAQAADLLQPDDPEHPRMLARLAEARAQGGALNDAVDTYRRAIAGLEALDDRRAMAVAMVSLSRVLNELHDPQAAGLAAAAVAALDGSGPSAELAEVLEVRAYWHELANDSEAVLATVERALGLRRELGLPESPRALMRRGIARCNAGDGSAALSDLERARDVAVASGTASEVSASHACLVAALCTLRGPRKALAVARAGVATARACHDRTGEAFLRASELEQLVVAGEWQAVLDGYEELSAWLEDRRQTQPLMDVRVARRLVWALRGDDLSRAAAAELDAERPAEDGPHRERLLAAAVAYQNADRDETAIPLLGALTAMPLDLGALPAFALSWPMALRVGIRSGSSEIVSGLIAGTPTLVHRLPHCATAVSALLDEHAGRPDVALAGYEEAARWWRELCVPFEEAHARFGMGRCLVALKRDRAAARQLHAAYGIFEQLGAQPDRRDVEAALAALPPVSRGSTRLK